MAESKTDISSLIDELRKEREELDGRLAEIERRRHLSVAEEVEVKRLKKLKLAKKDKLHAMQASMQK
jgi:uncharacterized protein YdcH (DUF465 family)